MSSADVAALVLLAVAVAALVAVARDVRRLAAELDAVRRAALRHGATHGELTRIMQVRGTVAGVGRGLGSLSRRRGSGGQEPPELTPAPEPSGSGSDLPAPPTPPDARPG